jgi:glycosyltransferase involved in cell wall biosynthesis
MCRPVDIMQQKWLRHSMTSRRTPDSVIRTAASPSVLFVDRQLDIGGIQRYLVDLARSLDCRKFSVSFATLYEGGELLDELRRHGSGPAVGLTSARKRGRYDAISLWRLLRIVRSARPDIVHSSRPIINSMTLVAGKLSRAITVWSIGNSNNRELPGYPILNRLDFHIARAMSRFVDLAIFNSHAGRNYYLQTGFRFRRFAVIPTGVDVRRFAPLEDARRELREQWSTASDTILVGMVARLDPIKDHMTFLQAASILSTQSPRWRFACIGGGDKKFVARLREESGRLGLDRRVIWTGNVAEPVKYYSALDILVSCSCAGEAGPYSIKEAMACGVPCVVTPAGDSELIVQGTGIVVPARDPQALAAALGAMAARLEGEGRQLRERARRRIVENFSLEHSVARTARELSALL